MKVKKMIDKIVKSRIAHFESGNVRLTDTKEDLLFQAKFCHQNGNNKMAMQYLDRMGDL